MPNKFALLFVAVAFSAFAFASPATAFQPRSTYTYIHNEAEYSVELPDAPMGETIWADGKAKIPYIDNPPKYGSVGEYAELLRVDPDTGDKFDVKITFVKAERDFLLSMTREKMMQTLNDIFKETHLDQQTREEHFNAGADTLKWATVTGFSADESNNLHFNAAHYLVGINSIMVLQVTYNVENKVFQGFYDTLAKSIKYAGLK